MCESIVVVGAAFSADVDAPTELIHSAPGAHRGQSPKQPPGDHAGREMRAFGACGQYRDVPLFEFHLPKPAKKVMRSPLPEMLARLHTARVNRDTVALQERDNLSRPAQYLGPAAETESGMQIDICVVDP